MTAAAGAIGTLYGCEQQQDRLNETVGNSATVEKTGTFSNQQQQQELPTRTLATAAETIGTTKTTTTKGRPATAGMPEIVEMPTTVIAASENKEFFLFFILHNCETYRDQALQVIISCSRLYSKKKKM
jgi:hypothetical protein